MLVGLAELWRGDVETLWDISSLGRISITEKEKKNGTWDMYRLNERTPRSPISMWQVPPLFY